MKAIGGYFSLELPEGESYYPNALALNTGRSCIEYILRCRHYRKLYIPYYTCDSVLEPLAKLGVAYEFYHINNELEPFETPHLLHDEAFVYTNYFGLKHAYSSHLALQLGKQLIIDNTQAFFAKPFEGVDSFNSCRKFFGVPDGAYLFSDAHADFEIEKEVSYDRASFLLKRIDLGAEAGYADFLEKEHKLIGQPLKRMSNLTERIMRSIDYDAVASKRRDNYQFLEAHLRPLNLLHLHISEDVVPMVYPFLTNDSSLKQRLIQEKVFVPTFWPNVLQWCCSDDFEYKLADNTLFLPIDQRYGLDDMKRIVDLIIQ